MTAIELIKSELDSTENSDYKEISHLGEKFIPKQVSWVTESGQNKILMFNALYGKMLEENVLEGHELVLGESRYIESELEDNKVCYSVIAYFKEL